MNEDESFELMQAAPTPRLKRARDGFSRMDVVQAFQQAFDLIGGTTRLTLWANANPDKFYPLYAKLMPSTSINITADGNQLVIEHAFPSPEAQLVLENQPHADHQAELRPPQALHAVPHAAAEVDDPGSPQARREDRLRDQ